MAANFSYPPGLIPADPAPFPLTTNRSTEYTYDLLSRLGAPLGPLGGVEESGTLTWDSTAKIKGGGKITVKNTGQEIDWLNVRIKIGVTVNGINWGLGVYLPVAPVEAWSEGHLTYEVELLDKLTILDEDSMTSTFSLPEGTVVTDIVRTLIQATGEANVAITDSDKTLSAPRVWEAGTSTLTICNELLDSMGYFTLRTDGNGAFVASPYVAPHKRAIRYVFEDDSYGIYSPAFRRDYDIFNVPNRIIAIQEGTGDEEGLVATAENTDPASPFSYSSRGRWITKLFTGVEATDLESLQTYANTKLTDSQRVISSVGITHAPIPLEIYDAVMFVSGDATLNARHVIDQTSLTLNPTALAASTLREVETYD